MSRSLMLGVSLLALGLRAYRLDAPSFWYDEGITVALATRNLEVITRSAAADIHPPFYYYLLHFWVPVVGTGEFAVRWLSVAAGVLLAVVVYRLGRALFSEKVALLAALLVAMSPLLVRYSQEARMYILVALLAALSMYLWWRAVEANSFRLGPWLGYTLVTGLALYSHYLALTIPLAHTAHFVLTVRRRRHQVLPWLVSQVALALAFIPWLALSWSQLQTWPATSPPFDLPTLAGRVFTAFSVGEGPRLDAAGLVFVGLLAAAPLAVRWRDQGRPFLLVVLYLVVPVLVLYANSLRRPVYHPKLLLFAVPAYLLLLALGLVGWQRLGERWLRGGHLRSAWRTGVVAVCLLAVALVQGQSLWALHFDPRFGRDDYRGLARFVEASWQEGDAVLLNAPGQVEVFELYFPRSEVLYPLPRQRPLDETDTLDQLRQLTSRHRRVWAVLWATEQSDPAGVVEGWLSQNAYQGLTRWFGGVRLVLYSLPEATDYHPLRASFGDRIELLGYSLERQEAQPGEVVGLTLHWQAIEPLAERYKVFVHLLDEREYLWGQHDSEPAGGSRPTVDWRPGDTVADRHGLPILVGTPPGEYDIEIGLYHPTTGERLPIPGAPPPGNRLILGHLRVLRPASPPTLAALGIRHSLSLPPQEGLRLLGYDALRAGSDSPELRPGDSLLLVLYWQTLAKPSSDYEVAISLLGAAGKVVVSRVAPPAERDHPTSRWEEGEVVRDQRRLELAQAGEYTIVVGLRRGSVTLPEMPIGKVVVR